MDKCLTFFFPYLVFFLYLKWSKTSGIIFAGKAEQDDVKDKEMGVSGLMLAWLLVGALV